MNFQRRGVRLTTALALTGLIASQIPMNSGVAVARDAYGGRNNTAGSTAIQIGVAGLVGYGIFATATGAAAGGAGGAGVGAAAAGAAAAAEAVDTSKTPLFDVLANSEDTKEFAAAIDKAGLKNELRKTGQFTAFVPTSAVFAGSSNLPGGYTPGKAASALTPDQKTALGNFLKGHIILGIYTIEQLKSAAGPTGTDGVSYPTLNGGTIKITYIDNVLKVNDAIVEQSDIRASNGIIHKVNAAITTTPAPANGDSTTAAGTAAGVKAP